MQFSIQLQRSTVITLSSHLRSVSASAPSPANPELYRFLDLRRRKQGCLVGQTNACSVVFRGKQRVGVLREFSSTFDFPVRRTGIVGFYYLYIYFYIYSVSHWHCFSHRFFDGVFEKHVRVSPLCSSPTVHYLLICGRREYMHYASFCKL